MTHHHDAGHNVIMWQGDGWQQAFDGRKEHDPQFWIPLHFDEDGTLLNMTRQLNWTTPAGKT